MIPIGWIGRGLAALGDLLLPPACAVCNNLLDHGGAVVCPDCLCGFEALSGPVCDRCGQPYPGAGRCPDCRDEAGHLDKIRSVYAYGGPLQEAVLNLKLNKKTRLAPFFADQIARADIDGLDLEGRDLLVPVPLHQGRQAARGFNQSQLIARRLSPLVNVPVAPFHLKRTRPTPSQFQMATRKQRLENVKNAFSVVGRHPFEGKKICLLDDVVTTGSTLRECARALSEAGAREIVAVTLARTVHW
jgi:competence protein ComFC